MKFGRVELTVDGWRITCEPHVRNRLRRVFPQASQRAGDFIHLTNNPENSRDLLWFLERYPMDMQKVALKSLKGFAAVHVENESVVSALLDSRRPPNDFLLALPPREYQKSAATLLEIKNGLLLVDDVGLGKTVTAICAMARSQNLPARSVQLARHPNHG